MGGRLQPHNSASIPWLGRICCCFGLWFWKCQLYFSNFTASVVPVMTMWKIGGQKHHTQDQFPDTSSITARPTQSYNSSICPLSLIKLRTKDAIEIGLRITRIACYSDKNHRWLLILNNYLNSLLHPPAIDWFTPQMLSQWQARPRWALHPTLFSLSLSSRRQRGRPRSSLMACLTSMYLYRPQTLFLLIK